MLHAGTAALKQETSAFELNFNQSARSHIRMCTLYNSDLHMTVSQLLVQHSLPFSCLQSGLPNSWAAIIIGVVTYHDLSSGRRVLPAWQTLVDDVVHTVDRHFNFHGFDIARFVNIHLVKDGIAHAAEQEVKEPHVSSSLELVNGRTEHCAPELGTIHVLAIKSSLPDSQ